jgi:aryl-alcohol dehydrogenase-like predicted oxidoreductase
MSEPMKTVALGRTNIEVSVAGLGCGGHSRLGMAAGHSEAHASNIVRHALDLGINFIDTARAYGTEAAVGTAIRGRRDEVVLSSKALPRGRDGLLSAAALTESLEKSLVRLGTDCIDVFHLHGVLLADYPYCQDELVPELLRQRDLGKIRFLGITERFSADTAHAMLHSALPDDHFDVIMVGFNLLNPAARHSVLPLTLKHDVGTLIMFAVRRALGQPAALAQTVAGLIASGQIEGIEGQVDGQAIDSSDPLAFVADHPDVGSVVEAAYRYCRHEPGAHVVLTGTGSIEHLSENVASILAPALPESLLERLNSLFGAVDSVSGD